MKSHSSGSNTALNTLCAAWGEGDGVTPKHLKRDTETKSGGYKHKQLCKQAGRIVNLMLSDQVNRPLLSGLQVTSVVPEQNGRTLKVTVAHAFVNPGVTDAELIAELKQVQGLLRSALAQSINRKQTPSLMFHYAGYLGEGANHAN